nr:NTP transferase domain-containing protein [Desulfobulbaceae bacterium]
MRKYGVILAARLGSQRLPGKALLPLQNTPMISFLIRRLQTSKQVSRIILATTKLPADDQLKAVAEKEGIDIFRGDRDDVVSRFVGAANHFNLEYVVRVTGDCPFVDGASLDYCIDQCNRHNSFEIASTKTKFPVGIDYEIYQAKAMATLHLEHLTADEREHLTLGMYNRPERFKKIQLLPPQDWPKISNTFTIDTAEDYETAQGLIRNLKTVHFDIATLLLQAEKQDHP